MLTHSRLCLEFDPASLEREYRALPSDAFISHYNVRDYDGEWTVLPLRSINGLSQHIYPDPTGTGKFANTEYLASSPYFQHVLNTFAPSVQSARLMKLAPGARIKEHTDLRLAIEDGEIRIHIPIVTNADVSFVVNGEPIVLSPGSAWYINFNLPHSVENRGTTERVHLVLDCTVNDALLSLFEHDVEQAMTEQAMTERTVVE